MLCSRAWAKWGFCPRRFGVCMPLWRWWFYINFKRRSAKKRRNMWKTHPRWTRLVTFRGRTTKQIACRSNCGFELWRVGCAQKRVLALPARRGKQLQLAGKVLGNSWTPAGCLGSLACAAEKRRQLRFTCRTLDFTSYMFAWQTFLCRENLFLNGR